MPATARLKQAARTLLISKRRNLLSDYAFLGKPNFVFQNPTRDFRWFVGQRTSDAYSTAAEDCIVSKLPIIDVWIIEGVMQAAAFFAAQGRIDNQRRDCREIA